MNPSIQAQGKTLSLQNGIELFYSDLGQSDSSDKQATVIFLQGSGPGASGWLNFRFNADYFVAQGFRVVIPDLPGFGDSSKPDLEYNLDFFSDTIFAFADSLGIDRFALVGNSLGGAVSIAMSLAQPERVSHLILMGCGALEDQATYFQEMEGIQAMTKVPLGSPEFTPAYLKDVLKLIVDDPKHITDELIEERFRILATQNPAVFKRMVTPNLTERLKDISCSVLGFWGAKDRFCPFSGAQKLALHCQDAQVITLSQCGHWVMIEHADLFNKRSVEFLTQ